MKFRHLYRKSGSLSEIMMSDYAPEVAKYPKSSPFWKCASLLFLSVNDAACSVFVDRMVCYDHTV